MSLSNAEFLDNLFRYQLPNTATTLHSFVGDPSTDGRWNGMPWTYGKKLPTLNPFANNYTCVSSFHATPEGKYYRRKVLFAALHCVMIDDLGTKLPMSDLKIEPTVLIETSPKNYQAWLFLEKPIFTLQHAEALINGMIEAGISAEMDPGMKGVTRVARLPEGANGKAKYLGERGQVWPQRVAKSNIALRYTPEAIAEAYGLNIELKAIAPVRPPPRAGIDVERAGLINWLKLLGHHKEEVRAGYHEIECPWMEAHSDKAATGTYYMEPEEMNSYQGGFTCHHGHCSERDISDLVGWVRAMKDQYTEEDKK